MELNVRWDAEIYLSTIYSHCTFAVDIYFNNLSLSVASYSSAGHSLHQSHRSDKFTFNWYSRRTHFRAHLFRSHHLIVSDIDNLFLTWCLICSMDWSILFVRFFLVSLHQIGQSVLAFQMGYWNLHSTHSTYFAVLSTWNDFGWNNIPYLILVGGSSWNWLKLYFMKSGARLSATSNYVCFGIENFGTIFWDWDITKMRRNLREKETFTLSLSKQRYRK